MSQALAGKKTKQENNEQESRKQKDEQVSSKTVVGKQTKEQVLPQNEAKHQQSQKTDLSAKSERAKEIPVRENSSAKKRQTAMDATVTKVASPGMETSPEGSGLLEKQGKDKNYETANTETADHMHK